MAVRKKNARKAKPKRRSLLAPLVATLALAAGWLCFDLFGDDPHRLVFVEFGASHDLVEHTSRFAGVVLPRGLA